MASSSLKAFLTRREFMVHRSLDAWMAPHPTDPLAPPIPMYQKKGDTLNLGRGRTARRKALRAERLAAKGRRA